jgi:hypothetical protein
MAGFLFLQSEGLINHLAVGSDAPNWLLQGLIFGRGHGEYFAELGAGDSSRYAGGARASGCRRPWVPFHQRTWVVAPSRICQALARHAPRRALTRIILLAATLVVDGGSF